ncbi:MAG: TraV family lipoprotein [Desulfobacterales bacterium]
MKTKWLLILLISILPLGGCQILNPYDASSDCPDPYKGDCVSMETAYRRSKADPNNSEPYRVDPRHDSPLIKDRPQRSENTPIPLEGDSVYKQELYQEIAGLVKQPITPVRISAKLMRVLILGYDREDRFYSHRYVFFESDKPRWILNIIE